ncbi:MAG TPA: hypothetical protein VGM44_10480 [Polyangiaceae bacterium]
MTDLTSSKVVVPLRVTINKPKSSDFSRQSGSVPCTDAHARAKSCDRV